MKYILLLTLLTTSTLMPSDVQLELKELYQTTNLENHSIVFDFICKAEEPHESWRIITEQTENLISYAQQNNNKSEENRLNLLTKTLDLIKNINELGNTTDIKGSLECNLYETDQNIEINNENIPNNSLIIRFSVTCNNNKHPERWGALHLIAQNLLTIMNNASDFELDTISEQLKMFHHTASLDNNESLSGALSISLNSDFCINS